MATTRISALTELTTPASADVLVINDDSAGSTKKIQLSNLIPDDAIDSEHYVAGSIDNEHLANDAVDSDELASGAVDIAHLSATGTPGTDFLRGDNTWATPTDTNTMGSGFTVSATTDSNATTITQGDDLMFTAGTGITTETTADGTVTIASTVTDTNTMGSGFTVSATTDSNATTITQGDDLMFTAGTGITCETTADGTVTISNTVSGASTATSSATGLIKIEDDTDQSVAAESVSTTANRTYGLQLNSSDQGVVNVPWTDTNTNYSAGDFKLDDLGAPDDNTDLDFTTSVHGLVPKGTDTGNFLKDDGTWAAAGGGTITALNSATENELVTVGATTTELDAEANLTFDGTDLTLGTGNLVIGTSGKGIDFSATSDIAGMTSELLDDYEEGTWTPMIDDETNDATMHASFDECSYTKIGKMVQISGLIGTTSLGSVTGRIFLSGLPFVVERFTTIDVGQASGLAITAGQVVGIALNDGYTYANLNLWDSAVGTSYMDASEWSADGRIAIGGTYLAA